MRFDRAMRVATFVLVAAILAVGTACDTDAAISDLERSADRARSCSSVWSNSIVRSGLPLERSGIEVVRSSISGSRS